MSLHPTAYADVLAKRMNAAAVRAFLVNTGWNGSDKRISLKYARAIINVFLRGNIDDAPTATLPIFNFYRAAWQRYLRRYPGRVAVLVKAPHYCGQPECGEAFWS